MVHFRHLLPGGCGGGGDAASGRKLRKTGEWSDAGHIRVRRGYFGSYFGSYFGCRAGTLPTRALSEWTISFGSIPQLLGLLYSQAVLVEFALCDPFFLEFSLSR